jgi:hypothetical protein
MVLLGGGETFRRHGLVKVKSLGHDFEGILGLWSLPLFFLFPFHHEVSSVPLPHAPHHDVHLATGPKSTKVRSHD